MAVEQGRHWTPPKGFSEAQREAGQGHCALPCLFNSLTDTKQPLVPSAGPDSRQLTWYSCGPTVYDAAHLGHARNYVTFDIVRRILEDYFGYSILYVMNVTDVDDKIIKRAKHRHLLAQYKQRTTDLQQVATDLRAAVDQSRKAQEARIQELECQAQQAPDAQASGDVAKRNHADKDQAALVAGEKLKLKRIQGATLQLQQAAAADGEGLPAHAAQYEAEFFEDMAALGCRPPDVLTRVSEYIPEIVQYVQKIVANAMAYEAQGSVYFDTAAFRHKGHVYGKLCPWAVGSATLASDDADSQCGKGDKRHPSDFALWKAAKPGEPSWESPWGHGRPGWHIECSAMASNIVGQTLDIHTGGEDLRFPHHDNELAQAEAFYHDCGCSQWVNYFLHTGHLSIEGLKMSKSLKNFVTIRQALKEGFTARQFRLMFALSPWEKGLQYGPQLSEEMAAKEGMLKNFFQNIEVALRQSGAGGPSQARWEEAEKALAAAVGTAQKRVHAALLDNLNTRGALDVLGELIRDVNKYLAEHKAGPGGAQPGLQPQPLLLRKAAVFVTRILVVFGISEASPGGIGFGGEGSSSSSTDDGSAPLLDVFAAFRDTVRGLAREQPASGAILQACDRCAPAGPGCMHAQLSGILCGRRRLLVQPCSRPATVVPLPAPSACKPSFWGHVFTAWPRCMLLAEPSCRSAMDRCAVAARPWVGFSTAWTEFSAELSLELSLKCSCTVACGSQCDFS
eukprot:jgi/Astpho2/5537/e_gw1.00079.20.1_t